MQLKIPVACVPPHAGAVLTSVLVGFGNLHQQLCLLGTVLDLVGSLPLLASTKPFPDYLHDFLINHPAGKTEVTPNPAKR